VDALGLSAEQATAILLEHDAIATLKFRDIGMWNFSGVRGIWIIHVVLKEREEAERASL
jgi:hypothetical protein